MAIVISSAAQCRSRSRFVVTLLGNLSKHHVDGSRDESSPSHYRYRRKNPPKIFYFDRGNHAVIRKRQGYTSDRLIDLLVDVLSAVSKRSIIVYPDRFRAVIACTRGETANEFRAEASRCCVGFACTVNRWESIPTCCSSLRDIREVRPCEGFAVEYHPAMGAFPHTHAHPVRATCLYASS